MTTKSLTIKSKQVTISSKGQITLPKAFLDKLDLKNNQEVLISLGNQKIEITNQKQVFKNKIQNFQPIHTGSKTVLNLSNSHNDIYE